MMIRLYFEKLMDRHIGDIKFINSKRFAELESI